MRNYQREFRGQPLLEKQSLVPYCAILKAPHKAKPLSLEGVRAYNQYTIDFNQASTRGEQEFLLDQRHAFFMIAGE